MLRLSPPPARPVDLTVRLETSILEVDRTAWDGLDHGQSPFLEWGFLAAAELSQSIGPGTGWDPHYLLVEIPVASGAKPANLVGAVVAFRKSHSYGEYIFDWAWARAAARGGVPYYPKLVMAAPATPASGRRLLLSRDGGVDRDRVVAVVTAAVRELADTLGCSSIHWLFCTHEEQVALINHGFLPRASFQFHWQNDGYTDFSEFLGRLVSRKRKQIRKERRRALEAVDALEFVGGPDLSESDLDAIDRYYRGTVHAHGGKDYFNPGFFHRLRDHMPEHMQFARARQGGKVVAGALYLETDQALYGRYWGCDRDIEFLHFEAAYYAGIERCIDHGLALFEAGAQGEHKLLRGFVPSPTYSAHWIRNRALGEGVRRFLQQEAMEVKMYMDHLREFSPYKREQ